jgi:hypothetical protein
VVERKLKHELISLDKPLSRYLELPEWISDHAICPRIVNDKLGPETLISLRDPLRQLLQVALVVIVVKDWNLSADALLCELVSGIDLRVVGVHDMNLVVAHEIPLMAVTLMSI